MVWLILLSVGNPYFSPSELDSPQRWTRLTAKPVRIGSELDALCRTPTAADYAAVRRKNPHAATEIEVFVTPGSATAIRARSRQVPEGTILVKRKTHGGKLEVFTVMKRTKKDWVYATVSAKGLVESEGKLKPCMGCHAKVASTGMVFGTYLARR